MGSCTPKLPCWPANAQQQQGEGAKTAAPAPSAVATGDDVSRGCCRWLGTPVQRKKRIEALQEFVVKHFLPLAFLVAIAFALAYPVPGRFLVNIVVMGDVHIIQEINIVIVFFISGLALNTQELKKALTRNNIVGIIYGFIAIHFITCCLGFVFREIPLEPKAFSIGLTIFSVVPTTLGIGIALTRSCKGNEAVALLLTVGTNMLGVPLMPPMLTFLFLNFDTSDYNITVDILNLFAKLGITIFVPSIVGKLLRDLWKPAEEFAKMHRTPLSLFSTANLAMIVWQTLSGARDRLFEQSAGMVFAVIGLAIGQHLVYLAMNYVVVWHLFRMPLKEAISVGIMASQKSAPVAVTVISYVTDKPEVMGLLAIPCIVGQISQIFIGSAIAPTLARKVDATYGTAKKKADEASPPAAAAPSSGDIECGGEASKATGTTATSSDLLSLSSGDGSPAVLDAAAATPLGPPSSSLADNNSSSPLPKLPAPTEHTPDDQQQPGQPK